MPRQTGDDTDTELPLAGGPGPAPGLLAGRFQLVRELGSGSSGTVYHARLNAPYRDLPAGADIAIKFLRQDRVDDEQARARLQAEGELGMRVRHDNVAAIFGVETIDVLGLSSTYLVMELVSGTTLRLYLREQGPPVEDLTRRIGAHAAQGLAALHRHGVVHRDVKPENLVLTPDGKLKIVDLGFARPFAADGKGSDGTYARGGSPGSSSQPGGSSGGGMAGNLAYAAPEALRGRATTPRSDLYALGVVLYEVSTGKHPFAGCTAADDLIHAHLFEAPRQPSHLRPRMTPLLEQLILELLQKDPDLRPREAAEVARILQQGEHSEWWRRHEQNAPRLASVRRLQRMRRPAEVEFVGRGEELAQLALLVQQARAGIGQAVTVSGPVGIGRRRLLDEAMASWLEHGQDLLYLGGEADSDLGHGEPFASSVLDWLLRGDERGSPHAPARAEARARDELRLPEADARALVQVALGQSTELPEVRADRLARALLHLQRRGRVLVLRVENAHRLDTSGRLVLQRLLQDLEQSHLLLLLTAGPDGLPGVPGERIELQGLPEPEFLAFGRSLFRGATVPDAFLQQAHAALTGSPGNLLESLEQLEQLGEVRGRAGDLHDLAETAEARPAPNHMERLQRRVALLPPDQRAVLFAAAVLGDRCQLGDLVALAGGKDLLVLETLSMFRGRVLRAQGGEVAFRHRDFRLALLRRAPETELRPLHARAAAVLAARGGDPLAVGLHRSHARDHEGCVEPLLQGLLELVRAGSRRTSLRIASRLQVHLQQLPDTPAVAALRLRHALLHARARVNAGQPEAAQAAFEHALVLATAGRARTSCGEARTGLATLALNAGRLDEAEVQLDLAHGDLAGASADADRELAAHAHAVHGRVLFYRGRATQGLRHLQSALRELPASNADLMCHYLIDLARMEALLYHYPTALKTLHKVEQVRAARHLPRVAMRLHLYRGQIKALLGDDGCTADLAAALDAAANLGLPVFAARAHLFLGERAFWRYRDDEARRELRKSAAAATAGNDQLALALANIHLMRLGEAVEDPAPMVAASGMPSLRLALLLAQAHAAGTSDDAASAQDPGQEVDALVEEADLPLSLHLRALTFGNRLASLRSLVRSIAERLDRTRRRSFLAEWQRGARI